MLKVSNLATRQLPEHMHRNAIDCRFPSVLVAAQFPEWVVKVKPDAYLKRLTFSAHGPAIAQVELGIMRKKLFLSRDGNDGRPWWHTGTISAFLKTGQVIIPLCPPAGTDVPNATSADDLSIESAEPLPDGETQ